MILAPAIAPLHHEKKHRLVIVFVFSLSFSWMQLIASLQRHLGGGNYNSLSKENLRVFAETRRVVVADGCGVAEAFQQR